MKDLELLKSLRELGVKQASFTESGEFCNVEFFPPEPESTIETLSRNFDKLPKETQELIREDSAMKEVIADMDGEAKMAQLKAEWEKLAYRSS